MRERPILFSAPEVRAILDGRKTMTRRAVKLRYPFEIEERDDGTSWPWYPEYVTGGDWDGWVPCPYGQPDDRLWVRETWGVISHDFDEDGNVVDWIPDRPATPIREMPFGRGYYSGHTIYRADGEAVWASDDDGGGDGRSAWMPSIHMPRWASRITLEVTSVRVERLQDISEEDACAEGIELLNRRYTFNGGLHESRTAVESFSALWRSINGADSWDANPWVWVIEFKRAIQ